MGQRVRRWIFLAARGSAAVFLAYSGGARGASDVVYQPGFHQALRWSVNASDRTTYRMKIPIGRGGTRLRVSFRAGDGALALYAATVAFADVNGVLKSPPAALLFNGNPGFSAQARQRFTSDELPFPVSPGAEIYVEPARKF